MNATSTKRETRREASIEATRKGYEALRAARRGDRRAALEAFEAQLRGLLKAQRRAEAARVAARWGGSAGRGRRVVWRGPVPGSVFAEAQPSIEGNRGLRVPQIEAWQALRAHVEADGGPAIVQLPVGCGKTGTMALAPFGIARGRVLVVAPNVEVRETLLRNLDASKPQCVWRRFGVLPEGGPWPRTAALHEDASIHDADRADIVVTNIQQLMAGNAETWLAHMGPDYFDMILVDEGHHNAADSWQRTAAHFPHAREVCFTATPMRADGQEVKGELIYRFPIAEAIRRGYVKDLSARRLDPEEVRFTYQGSEQTLSLVEVLALREEAWFRRGLALSPESNRHIVDASLNCLDRLRADCDRGQKVIASACSVDHAQQIRALYAERGRRAEVLHSHLPAVEQERVRGALARGELDVVVQVQMLGEGADYPELSVAAIFRPFRHAVPFVQFVGRVMRVLEHDAPGHPANRGYVVSHAGFDLERFWEDLRTFDGALSAYAPKQVDPEVEGRRGSPGARRFQPDMEVVRERMGGVAERRLLAQDAAALVDDLVRTLEDRGMDLDALGVRREDVEARLREEGEERQERLEPVAVQPQEARKEARRRLNERVRAGGRRVLQRLGLKAKDRVLIDFLGTDPDTSNDLSQAIILLNREVKGLLGVGSSERDVLTVEELQSATRAMDSLVARVVASIENKVGW